MLARGVDGLWWLLAVAVWGTVYLTGPTLNFLPGLLCAP